MDLIILSIYNFHFLVLEFLILYYICIPFLRKKLISDHTRRGGWVAETSSLLNCRTREGYRGFESPSLRKTKAWHEVPGFFNFQARSKLAWLKGENWKSWYRIAMQASVFSHPIRDRDSRRAGWATLYPQYLSIHWCVRIPPCKIIKRNFSSIDNVLHYKGSSFTSTLLNSS